MKNHYSINPIKCFVKDDVLFNDDRTTITEATIIGLCLYKDETICFDVILKNGSIFNYIPLHKVIHKHPTLDNDIELKDLVYHNCPSLDISINKFDFLTEKNGKAFLKHKNLWVDIDEYILTVDWYEGNDLLNLVKLHNGYFAFLPNHKIKFGDVEETFEKYKKVPYTYVV